MLRPGLLCLVKSTAQASSCWHLHTSVLDKHAKEVDSVMQSIWCYTVDGHSSNILAGMQGIKYYQYSDGKMI